MKEIIVDPNAEYLERKSDIWAYFHKGKISARTRDRGLLALDKEFERGSFDPDLRRVSETKRKCPTCGRDL